MLATEIKSFTYQSGRLPVNGPLLNWSLHVKMASFELEERYSPSLLLSSEAKAAATSFPGVDVSEMVYRKSSATVCSLRRLSQSYVM